MFYDDDFKAHARVWTETPNEAWNQKSPECTFVRSIHEDEQRGISDKQPSKGYGKGLLTDRLTVAKVSILEGVARIPS